MFKEKVALVTGASQGIGEVIAVDLAQNGAEVVLLDIQKEKLDQVAGKITAEGGKAAAYQANVSDFENVRETMTAVLERHGKIDFLINNAGITRDNFLVRMQEEDWDAVLAVNLKGVFNVTKAALRSMISSRYGRIVNISSVVGLMGNATQTNYSASKAGVVGFTKSLAREVAARGITVNAVAPGYIETAMTDILSDAVKAKFLENIPMKRMGTPKDVSGAVRFLLSEAASYITGQVISVNGGMLM